MLIQKYLQRGYRKSTGLFLLIMLSPCLAHLLMHMPDTLFTYMYLELLEVCCLAVVS